jgi:DNA-binding IclR family transcriptional regulator
MCIAAEPTMRVRDIAARAGITERATHRIVSELEHAGFLSHERVGRRNHYEVHVAMRTGHPLERHLDIASLSPDPESLAEPGATP